MTWFPGLQPTHRLSVIPDTILSLPGLLSLQTWRSHNCFKVAASEKSLQMQRLDAVHNSLDAQY